jgi:tetratricopeptide (TPR) repeat protein
MDRTSDTDPPKVFISYSHDSEAHRNNVLALANRLRADGVDCVIDQYFEDDPPPQGWPRWMLDCVEETAFVLVVRTETYERRFRGKEAEGKGKGVKWEGAIITQELYDREGNNTKFIPLLFADADEAHIPLPLRSTTYYKPLAETGYESLHRRLTKQRRTTMPDVGNKRVWQSGSAEPVTPTAPRPASTPSSLLPHFAHTYPIQKNFTGRVRERRMLTEWLTSGDKPVFAFIAIGGMGKSALTWAWVQRDVLGDALPSAALDEPADAAQCRVPEDQRPTGVFWWSFYEREASFATFVKQALVYASRGAIKLDEVPSTAEQVRALLPLLREQRLLLVLDGFERELRAYASLSAAYQGDAVMEDARDDYRAATSPHAAWFLRAIGAQALQSRVLLTSRLLPHELDELAGCERQDLDSLDPADAVTFFQAQGVRGTRAEIEEACQPYGYHPLSLRLLAGVILRDKRTPGEMQVAKRYEILPELKGKEQHHILQVAYEDLGEEKHGLLSRIAAFRSPMKYEGLLILNSYENEKRFDEVLDELIERGWLFFDYEQRRYDMHPVARRYAYDRLMDKQDIHFRLRDYFATIPSPSKARSIEGLDPVIELYHHTVHAGRYDEALGLFRDRLNKSLYLFWGEYYLCIELLKALFPNGETEEPSLKNKADQAWALNKLGLCYGRIGKSRPAVSIFQRHTSIREAMRYKSGVAIGLGNLSEVLIRIGRFKEASETLGQKINLCLSINDQFHEMGGRQDYGLMLAYQGNFTDSDNQLEKTRDWLSRQGKQRQEGVTWAFCTISQLLQGNVQVALESAMKMLHLANVENRERDVIRAKFLMGKVQIALLGEGKNPQSDLLAETETHLTGALTRCRRINLVELEPDILLAWARLHHARSHDAQAIKDAQEALAIADRCEYRLKQAEIHNFLAQLAAEANQPQEAIRHAQQAYERAWCDGPPYCYKPALEEAERRLGGLGAPLPKL